MAEKIIPDVEFFAEEINAELQEDLSIQGIKIAERLMNFPPENVSELHLQDWYGAYWGILDMSQYVNEPPENKENSAQQILEVLQSENDPIRRQYFALALLLFDKVQEFTALADISLWSEKLHKDFEAYSRFSILIKLASTVSVRAQIRRNQYIKNFLNEKYSDLVKKYSASTLKNCPKVAQKDFKIWYCWLQGEENLIPLARVCYESLKMNAGKYKICFINENNFADYIKLPEYVIQKFKEGKITRTHFSDILRVNLLEQYGGLWLDATILVAEPLEKYNRFWKMPYFTHKFFHDKDDSWNYVHLISGGRWAGYIQGAAILHNPLFVFIKELFNEYWREFDELIEYLLLDYALDMAYKNIPCVKREMDDVPINNRNVTTLLNQLNTPYEQFPYDKVIKDTFLFKLIYKVPLDLDKPNTIFREMQKKFAPNTIGQF